MQFKFMIGRGTTDAIFIVKQIQEAYVKKKRNLFFAFTCASDSVEKSFCGCCCCYFLIIFHK